MPPPARHPTEGIVESTPTPRGRARREIARYGTGVATVEETASRRGRRPIRRPSASACGSSSTATTRRDERRLGAFAAAGFVAFLWPTATGGFGQPVNIGKVDDVKDGIRDGQGFFYAPSACTWVTAYPADALPKAAAHLPRVDPRRHGARARRAVPEVPAPRVPRARAGVTSQWFECPCHGSQYNQVGEKKAGPAPRGMDHFPITVGANGDVVVNTGIIVTGAPIGTNTTGQEAEGPHCITGGGEQLTMVALATTSIA